MVRKTNQKNHTARRNFADGNALLMTERSEENDQIQISTLYKRGEQKGISERTRH